MKNINAQIQEIRAIGTDSGLAAIKRKHVIARAVKAVFDMQKAVGPSAEDEGLETMRVEFYQYSFAAYLWPNDPTSETSLMNAQAVRERAPSTYDEREKAAYGSTRNIWSEIRKQCGLTDATRSQAAKDSKADKAAKDGKADKADKAAPEMTIQSGRDVVAFMALRLAEAVMCSDKHTNTLNDYRHEMARKAVMECRSFVNECLNMPEKAETKSAPKVKAKK